MTELLNKEQLEAKIGKASFWNPKRTVNLCLYLAGIESFDEKIDVNSVLYTPNITDFEIHANGLSVQMVNGFKSYKIGIKNEHLISIALEDKEQIYEKKEKSVVGRAVVGGLLLGGVGAIVGAMTGLKDGEKKAKMPDLILSIEIGKDKVVEKVLMFSCKYTKKGDLIKFFTENFKDKFSVLA